MAEMAVAIMVVSLPSMRSFLQRGGIFSSKKVSAYSSSRGYGHQIPDAGSNSFALSSKRSRYNARVQIEDDSGSEVELNTMGRKDVIYETRRISVQFSNLVDETESSTNVP